MKTLMEMPQAEVVGFVDNNEEACGKIEATFGLRRFASVAELANDIECAVVATPTITHADVAAELLAAGKDVLVEKPITATVDEARRLIDLAAKHDRVLQVGHVERYNPAIQAIAALVGHTRFFEAERLGIFSGRSLDIDVVLDLMIHDLDLVLALFHQKVVAIQAVGVPVLTEKVDIANVRLELANGAAAILTASRVRQEEGAIRKQRFFSSEAYISVDTFRQEVKGYRLLASKQIESLIVTVDKRPPLQVELESFLRCVRERSRPLVTGEDGMAAVALAIDVATAIDESMKRWRE